MIQRIQTVYLLLATILMTLMMFFPLVEFQSMPNDTFVLSVFGIKSLPESDLGFLYPTFPLAILTGGISLLSLLDIFLYKKRNLQARVAIYNIILMVGLVGLIYFYTMQISSKLNASQKYLYPVIFPLISAILTFLGYKGIRKDIKLLRSLDRIR